MAIISVTQGNTVAAMEYYVEKLKREGKYYAIPSEQLQKGYIKHGVVMFTMLRLWM